MSIWHKLMYWIGLRPNPGPRKFEITERLQVSLKSIAQHEGRPEDELIRDLLAAGLTQYSTDDQNWKTWESLTPREQEAAAFVCLGFSNGQIASRMGITLAGVKFHLGNVYSKFGVRNRSQLRKLLAGWDFSAWLKLPKGFHFLQ